MRFVRGAVVGVATVVLGAGGHALAGGMLPPAHLLAPVLAVAVVLGVALTARRWSVPALLLVLGLGQATLHVVLAGTHSMIAMPSGDAAVDAHPWGVMLAAHAVATCLSAIVLARSDAWCLRLLELLRGSPRPVAPAVLPTPTDTVVVATGPFVVRRQWWIRSQQRRGPPRGGVAAAA